MSYSLTMIPDWRAALANATRLLRPGGYIAVSDFTVTPENSWFTRTLWPAVFKLDGIKLSHDHIDELRSRFEQVHLKVEKGGFPYVPFLKAPFYYFIGRKPTAA
jgi:S-adenosylmethionine-diacylgycerolhomoserine-N-methlytransferase